VLPDEEDNADKETLELSLSPGQAVIMDETPHTHTPESVYYSVHEQLLNGNADKDHFLSMPVMRRRIMRVASIVAEQTLV
jgi:hypothetical protein